MWTDIVIPPVGKRQDILIQRGFRLIVFLINQLRLQCIKEAFHWRIIIWAPCTAHALQHTFFLTVLPEFRRGILAALVAMQQDPPRSPCSLKGLPERIPAFLGKALAENPLKGEYFLPGVVDQLIKEQKASQGKTQKT